LQAPPAEESPTQLHEEEHGATRFEAEDKIQLGRLVSESHLTEEFISTAQSKFVKSSYAKLPNFLASAAQLLDICHKRDHDDGVGNGLTSPASLESFVGNGWELVGPASQQRCLHFTALNPATGCTVGESLASVATLFKSLSFMRYLEALTGLRILGTSPVTLEIRRFRWGRLRTAKGYEWATSGCHLLSCQ